MQTMVSGILTICAKDNRGFRGVVNYAMLQISWVWVNEGFTEEKDLRLVLKV